MIRPRFLDDLQARLEQIFAASPAKDLEKNIKTAVSNALTRFDVASREELDIQTKVLQRTRERLTTLEARVAELEAKLAAKASS